MSRLRLIRGSAVAAVTIALAIVPSAASAAELGGLAFTPSKGSAETLMTLTTERGCTEGAAVVTALMAGPGMPSGGQVIFGPSALELSTTSPMVLPVSNAFVVFAQDNATTLDGKYTVTVQCLDAQAATVLDSFDSTMTWEMPKGSSDAADARYVAVSNAKGLPQEPSAPSGSSAGGSVSGSPDAGVPAPSATAGSPAEPNAGAIDPLAPQDKELADGSNPAARPADADAESGEGSSQNSPARAGLITAAVVGALVALGLLARPIFRGRPRPEQSDGRTTADDTKEHVTS
jgi:hypothetical protein